MKEGKHIAILLSNAIHIDGRVQRIVRTFSSDHRVDLFYFDPHESDNELFNNNVKLIGVIRTTGLKTKIYRHSAFYREFEMMKQYVLKENIKYDMIYANDLTTLTTGVKIKRELSSKLVYDSHEIFTETFNQFFPRKTTWKTPLFKLIIWMMKTLGVGAEKRSLKEVDHFVTVNDRLANYFKSKYKYEEVKPVYNCPYLKDSKGIDKAIDLRSRFGWGEKDVILIYQGMMNHGRGLSKLVNAIGQLPDRFKLILLGHGPTKSKLEKLIADLGLESRVRTINFVPSSELLSYTMGADIGVTLLQNFNISTLYATPNKLFEYIHAELHIISTKVPECEKIIQENNLGITCGYSVKEIAEAISTCEEHFNPHGKPPEIEATKKKYSWEHQEQTLISVLND